MAHHDNRPHHAKKHHMHHSHEHMHKSMHEHKPHGGMIDNRMVHDSHQEGICRVLQRHEDRNDVMGHHGKMGMGHEKAHWSRKGDALTPRKA